MLGHNFDIDTFRMTESLLHDASSIGRICLQNVAALSAENCFRLRVLHSRSSAIHPNQSSGWIEDKDTVRHGIECRFPLFLGARDYLEQLGLGNTGC